MIFYNTIMYAFALIIVFLVHKRINNCIKNNTFRRNDYVFLRICILIGVQFLSLHYISSISYSNNIFSITLYQCGYLIMIFIVEELMKIMQHLNMQMKEKKDDG